MSKHVEFYQTPISVLDARYLVLTGSLASVSNHSHTVLTDIGSSTHAQLDTFKNTTVPATYAPLASPTFTTNITTPLIIGGTAVGSKITYKSTVGIGTTTGIAHQFIGGTDGATVAMTILNDGSVGIGITVPTAVLHLKAGTTAANTAPLKFTTQASPLTTVEQGTMELVGNSLQFSQLARRRGVAMSQKVIIDTTTTANTTTESAALIIASHGADYFEVGKREEIELNGMIAQRANPAAILTIRIKYAGVTQITITTPASTVINSRQFTLRVQATVRTTGATGTLQMNAMLFVSGLTVDPSVSSLTTINTTIAQDTTVTAQWGEANVADTISIEQGRVLCIEPNR